MRIESCVLFVALFIGAVQVTGQQVTLARGEAPRDVEWNHDGSKLATVNPNGEIRVWDQQGSLLWNALAHEEGAMTVAWSPDGSQIVTGGFDPYIRVWDTDTGGLIRSFQGHLDGTAIIIWNPDGIHLATLGFNELFLWDVTTGTLLATLPSGTTFDIAWSPAGDRLVAAATGRLNVFELSTRNKLFQLSDPNDEPIRAVAWSPNAATLATGSAFGTLRLWDVASQTEQQILSQLPATIDDIAFRPDGTSITVALANGTVLVINTQTGALLETFTADGAILAVDWKPDGSQLAYVGVDNDSDPSNDLHIVNTPVVADSCDTGSLASNAAESDMDSELNCDETPSPVSLISTVAWSPDGSMIAVGYGTGQCVADRPDLYVIEIIDVATSQVIHTLSGANCTVMALDWSPDGSKLVSASLDGIGIRVWDAVTGQLLVTKQRNGQGNFDVNWSPDEAWLAITDYGEVVTLLDAATGDVFDEILPGTVADWNPDGSKLLSGSYSTNDVYIAEVVTGGQYTTLSGHTAPIRAVDWSPDGTKLASGSIDHTVRVWDAVTGNLLLTLQGHTDFVTEVVWSPDSSQVASGSADGTIRVWDAETGEQVDIIQEGEPIWTLAWSPDGTQLAYNGASETLEIVSVVNAGDDTTATPQP